MPHINYHRGETRTLVVRRENKSRSARWGPRRMRGRAGLAKRYMVLAGFGIRNWCPCCEPMTLRTRRNRKNRSTTRIVNRLDRIDGRRQCAEGLLEWEEEISWESSILLSTERVFLR